MHPRTKAILTWVAVCTIAAAALLVAWAVWLQRRAGAVPEGFAAGNGRLEATQVDIATKFAGRVVEVLVREGDSVEAGQIVARMDAQSLVAQLREAEAQVVSARSSKATAASLVRQRLSAKATADALAIQRKDDVVLAQQQFDRTKALLAGGAATPQQFDVDRNRLESATAARAAANSQVEEARTAIDVSQAEVAAADGPIQAALAAAERLRADLADCELRAPRGGRIQHRLVEPGEVLPAGGKVLVLTDLTDVYMTVFLPEAATGKLVVGGNARLVLDAAPGYILPAAITYVAAEAQFTPKTVETSSERQKLMFEVRLQLDPAMLRQYAPLVKAGLPGVGYVRVDPAKPWPAPLAVKLPPEPTRR